MVHRELDLFDWLPVGYVTFDSYGQECFLRECRVRDGGTNKTKVYKEQSGRTILSRSGGSGNVKSRSSAVNIAEDWPVVGSL